MTAPAGRGVRDRLRGVLAEHGRRWGLVYLASRLLERASGGAARLVAYTFVAQPVDLKPFAALRDDPATVVRQAYPSDAVVTSFPRPPDINRMRFRSGAECHVVEVRGVFAGHLWLSRWQHDEDEVRCRYELLPAAKTAWDFDVYIAPAWRSGRAMARLWKGVNVVLAGRGVHWSLSRISRFNAASRKAHERLGAVPVATAVFFVAGPLQVAAFSQAPFVHLGLGARSLPVLRLAAPAAS